MRDDIKLEKLKNEPPLKREIIMYLFDKVSERSRDQWWKFTGEFIYENENYWIECECKRDEMMFSYRNLHITRPQQIIDVGDILQ